MRKNLILVEGVETVPDLLPQLPVQGVHLLRPVQLHVDHKLRRPTALQVLEHQIRVQRLP